MAGRRDRGLYNPYRGREGGREGGKKKKKRVSEIMGLHFVLIFIQHKLQIVLNLLQLLLKLPATPSVIITDSVKITDGGCTGDICASGCEGLGGGW